MSSDERPPPEPSDPVLAELRRALQGPVATILSGLGALDPESLAPEEQRILRRVVTAAKELDGTVAEVDHVLAVLAGRYLSDVDDGDPGAIVRAVVASRQERARAAGLELAVRVDPDVPRRVELDGAALARVASGLIDHAVRQVTDGRVEVAVRREPGGEGMLGKHGGVQLRVVWSGGPRDEAPHGLGLAMATRQATLAGGTTGATVGRGHGVWVRLPFLAEPDALPTTPSGPRPLRVLVVEDDAFSSMMAELQVELAGHVPLAARSREETLSALASDEPPDLLLMDRNLGGADGRDLAAEIRGSSDTWASTPIIGLSASVLEEDRAQCLAAGMDEYLVKPLSSSRLSQVIADLIDRGRLPDRRVSGASARTTEVQHPEPSRDVTAIREHLEALADELGDAAVVAQICERFLLELPNRLGQLAVAALQRDRDAFRASAHRFRGAAAAVGGDVLIEAIDAAKEVTDPEDLPRVSEAIRQAAMKVRLALQAWLEDGGQGGQEASASRGPSPMR